MTGAVRFCAKCQQDHPVGDFYIRKNRRGEPIPGGYCKPCTRKRSQQSFMEADKAHVSRRNKAWFDRQPEEYRQRVMAGRARQTAERRLANPDMERERARQNAARRRATIAGTLKNRICAGMSSALRRKGAARKGRMHWEDLVGYTADELRVHLEAQFLPGMTWENRREWHIDHVRPLASFDFDGPLHSEFRQAWALSNLQPLWCLDNQRKHAKLDWQPTVTA